MKKILYLMLIILIAFSTFITPIAYANNIETIVGTAEPKSLDEKHTTESKVLGAIQWVGYAIAIGMIVYIGIKYVSSAADERANLKGALIKYVIGAILIASAATITHILFNIDNEAKMQEAQSQSNIFNSIRPTE